jgi:multiple sugar transport system permease protein
VLPALLVLATTIVYPLASIFVFSCQDLDLTAGDERGRFVGLANYQAILTSYNFPGALGHSLLLAVVVVVATVTLGMGIALLLNGTFPGRTLARSLVILPWAMPAFVAAFAWRWILDFQYGAVNHLIRLASPESPGIAFLSQPGLAFWVAALVYVWKGLPWTTLVLLAGLQVVPQDQREAARVDGASAFHEWRHVVLPSITFVLQITVTLLFIWNFNWFDMMWLLTQGGPGRTTAILPIDVYMQAFQAFNSGYASALGVIILAVVVSVALMLFRLWSRQEAGL